MNGIDPRSARKELLRYLRMGKSARSRIGANHIRNYILESLADPAVHRLCREYQMKAGDLCLACTEILDRNADLSVTGGGEIPASLLLFSDPGRLEGLLGKLRAATHGQAAIQRRLAIEACARNHAGQMAAPVADQRPAVTRSNLLKKSIFNNLLLMMLIAGLVVAGILLALFLL